MDNTVKKGKIPLYFIKDLCKIFSALILIYILNAELLYQQETHLVQQAGGNPALVSRGGSYKRTLLPYGYGIATLTVLFGFKREEKSKQRT